MKRFAVAFSVGLLAFALVNYVACIVLSDDSDDPDATERWGYPFLVSERLMITSVPDLPYKYFCRRALYGDFVIAALFSGLGAGIYVQLRPGAPRTPISEHVV